MTTADGLQCRFHTKQTQSTKQEVRKFTQMKKERTTADDLLQKPVLFRWRLKTITAALVPPLLVVSTGSSQPPVCGFPFPFWASLFQSSAMPLLSQNSPPFSRFSFLLFSSRYHSFFPCFLRLTQPKTFSSFPFSFLDSSCSACCLHKLTAETFFFQLPLSWTFSWFPFLYLTVILIQS